MRQEVDQHVAAQVVEDLAVVVDVSRRLVVGHHDDLFGLVLVGQHARGLGQRVLEVGAVDVTWPSGPRRG